MIAHLCERRVNFMAAQPYSALNLSGSLLLIEVKASDMTPDVIDMPTPNRPAAAG